MPSLSSSNSLTEWLSWLETLHPKSIDLGLTRIKQVAVKLDLFYAVKKTNTKIITVAGTNGKGTCVAALQALLLGADKTVGSYTSPHLLRYNERIAINGSFATDQDIVNAFQQIDQAREDITLSYFEFGTLAACLLFLKAGAEYWLLEVGLGGRLDAVNIFDADVAIVTSIDLDHQNWLGDDREKIGFEKAGIFRPSKLAICVDPQPPQSLLNHAKQLNTPLLTTKTINWVEQGLVWQWQGCDSESKPITLTDLPYKQLPLPSLSAALQTTKSLGINFSEQTIRTVLNDLELSGRCQRIEYQGRHIVLDVAHNPAAANNLVKRLNEVESDKGKILAVFAVMADKDIAAIVKPLSTLIEKWFVSNLDHIPRAAEAKQIADALKPYHSKIIEQSTVTEAIKSSIKESETGDTILIFGSFYTVAEALQWLNNSNSSNVRSN